MDDLRKEFFYEQKNGYDLVSVSELIESGGGSIAFGEDYQRQPGT